MEVTEQLVEKLLSIHDDEFSKRIRYQELTLTYNVGSWYWSYTFYATRHDLGINKSKSLWTFNIGDYFLRDARLEEKFERIYQKYITNKENVAVTKKEQFFKKILQCLK